MAPKPPRCWGCGVAKETTSAELKAFDEHPTPHSGKAESVLMSSSCGWRDQESQREIELSTKREASRGDLELEEWLNTPARYALGHENYSEHLKNRGCKEGL